METWKGKEGVLSLFRVLGLSTEDGGLVHTSPRASRNCENKDEDPGAIPGSQGALASKCLALDIWNMHLMASRPSHLVLP